MSQVMVARLPHVEWGERVSKRSILITSVGYMAREVISAATDPSVRTQLKSKMIAEVQLALQSLHDLQFSHCDLCLNNVFYEEAKDGNPARFFLADLEYLSPIDGLVPIKNLRLESGMEIPRTPLHFDELNYQLSYVSS